jgi:hypothetical protein
MRNALESARIVVYVWMDNAHAELDLVEIIVNLKVIIFYNIL